MEAGILDLDKGMLFSRQTERIAKEAVQNIADIVSEQVADVLSASEAVVVPQRRGGGASTDDEPLVDVEMGGQHTHEHQM